MSTSTSTFNTMEPLSPTSMAHPGLPPSPPTSTSSKSASPPMSQRPLLSARSSISAKREIILRHRAGTLATLSEREALRRQMRHTHLRWVDGGAVYVDRATGEYWEITGPLLTYLRARRHSQVSQLQRERLAAFESQLNHMSPAQVGAVVQQVRKETEMVIMEGRRRGDPDWRPEGFVDRAPTAMAEAQRRGILCGPLEDKEILAGLDSWFESQTPAMSPAGVYNNAFSPRAGA